MLDGLILFDIIFIMFLHFFFKFEIQRMIHRYPRIDERIPMYVLLSSKIMNLFFVVVFVGWMDGWLVGWLVGWLDGSSILWGTTNNRSCVFHFGFSKRLPKPVRMVSMIVKASCYYLDALWFIGKVPMTIYDGMTILVSIGWQKCRFSYFFGTHQKRIPYTNFGITAINSI